MNDTTDEAALSEESSQINAEVLQNISVTLSIVNERYGIRLTRVVPASERMKNL